MNHACIDFQKVLDGEYARRRNYGPMASYYANMGARVMTSDFADKNLLIKASHPFIINLFKIINSTRFQKDFDTITISGISSNYRMTDQDKLLLQELTLTEIEGTIDRNYYTLKIKLLDKIAHEQFIRSYEGRTNLHHEYKTKAELKELIKQYVPHPPSVEEFLTLLKKYNVIHESSRWEMIKDCYSQWMHFYIEKKYSD